MNYLKSNEMFYHLSDQGTFTPVRAKGGFHGTPQKTTFAPEFCNEICPKYARTIKIIIQGKNKMLYRFEMAAK